MSHRKGPLAMTILLHTGTAELQWLEHLWNHENMFETGVVRVNDSLS